MAKGAYSVGVTALVSWAAGEAAPSWHLSVPFLAGWVVLLCLHALVDNFTGIVGYSWHREKVFSAAQLAAMEKTGEAMAEKVLADYLASKQ